MLDENGFYAAEVRTPPGFYFELCEARKPDSFTLGFETLVREPVHFDLMPTPEELDERLHHWGLAQIASARYEMGFYMAMYIKIDQNGMMQDIMRDYSIAWSGQEELASGLW